MPNLSSFYMILMFLSFLLLNLPSSIHAQNVIIPQQQQQPSPMQYSSAIEPALAALTVKRNAPEVTTSSQQVRLSRNETVCKSMDLRNTPSEFRQLENCTVIEGFLILTLVNTHSFTGFTDTFPLLTEVTEFIVVYRVHNLRSLAQLLPNLSVIRGRLLFEGYAITVYMNPHLEELGLSKLTTISRGGVRIENNISLCFIESIDWSLIVSNATDIIKKGNRPVGECPSCPGDNRGGSSGDSSDNEVACRESSGVRRCWNSKSCQKICPERCRNNCLDETTCCNESCLGGCSPHNINECTSCSSYSIHNNTCTDKCPPNYYSYLNRRCITAETCMNIGTKFENNKQETLIPFNGVCSVTCPEGYNKITTNFESKCEPCGASGTKCIKKCAGIMIDSISRANEYRGCTHIVDEGITISIKRGGRHLMEDLEYGLSSIEVIETFLKVHRTYGMLSLKFFKNLKTIAGKTLYEDKYALYALENNDLETIWGPNQTVIVEKGRLFFHFNPNLCYSEIEKLLPMMKNDAPFNSNEVSTESNGSKGSCGSEELITVIEAITARVAHIKVKNPIEYGDERTFIGYQVFFIEDKYKNATKYGHRVCDDGWMSNEPTKDLDFLLSPLEPYTQYAYYIKTMTISSERRNAQSPIQYFTTKSSRPALVQKLRGYAKSDSEIIVNWLPPDKANGNLTHYIVKGVMDLKIPDIGPHNFCKDPPREPEQIDPELFQKPPTDKPQPNANEFDCSKCQKRKDGDNNEDDASRHDRIDFENALQNFIYVKQQKNRTAGIHENVMDRESDNNEKMRRRRSIDDDFDFNNAMDSFLVRHMRSMPNEIDRRVIETNNNKNNISNDSNNNKNNSSAIQNTTTTMLVEKNVMDPTGQYYEKVSFIVNASTLEYSLKKLKHFSLFTLEVSACRADDGSNDPVCSEPQTAYVRTQKLRNVDKVENLSVMLETTNTSRSNIRIRWDPPERPNGAIVSYTIAYIMLAQDAAEEKKCITELDYRNMTNGYVLTGLSTGNYSIRVRANSLAGEGIFSEALHVDIPPTHISTTVIVIIVLASIMVVVLIGILVRYLRKKSPPSDLKIFPTVNPYYISLQYIPDDWEVPRERVLQLSPLGQGSFGMVYEGILKGYNNSAEDTPCAIKTVNENATDRERMNFLNEASVMKQFDTFHVVRLLGVCSRGQPALVIMELMKNGDLKSYLRAHRPDENDDGIGMMDGGGVMLLQPPPLSRIYQMAIEIADGMAYLSAKKFVHRDLAARNCMVAADLTVKIGDFGMTRDIYETDYYRKGTKGLLPVRWMPPESLRDGVYSSASDVFSYGVVLWEMATLASQPYQGLSNDQVLRYVIDGGVMERPENCPDKLYRLMQKCWHHRPSARPTFMDIISFLLDISDPHFREVSFYHSDEGEQVRTKEMTENMQNSGDVFNDHDNDMDDVTTPLRMGEYNEYKLNVENNSSVENQGDIDDDHPPSPYSVGSAVIISSTPDGQSKNSFKLTQMMHSGSNAAAHGSAPIAAAFSGSSNSHLQEPQTHQMHQPNPHARYDFRSADAAAYVLPDFDPREFQEDDAATSSALAGKSVETDERGYQLYDPSPNYRERVAYDAGDDDDEEDFRMGSLSGRAGKLSGGENLLPRQKAGRHRVPTIMPMSSSMPDEVIGAPMSSSLHPSTASAASSNASSTATTTGKYPSLKKAVADTVQNVGNTLMPRFRNINRKFFDHKRTGSNASHKSTSSNPNTASTSNTNLTGGGKSMSGQNLGTIESGGSGSAGSYCPAPRFFTPAAVSAMSENPNYKLLDETANASCISAAAAESEAASSTPAKTISKAKPTSYQLLSESLNTTATPTKSASTTGFGSVALKTTDNPNYEPLDAPASSMHTTDNPNYIMMTAPDYAATMPSAAFARMTENPNYQMMGPPQSSAHNTPTAHTTSSAQPFSTLSAAMRREQSRERFHNSATSSSASPVSSEDEPDDEYDVGSTDPIKLPLSRLRDSERKTAPQSKQQRHGTRSRSQSQTKTEPRNTPLPSTINTTAASPFATSGSSTTVTTPAEASVITTTTAAATHGKPRNTFSLKENWLRQQQQTQPPPPPPPNGFIGATTTPTQHTTTAKKI